MKIHEILLNSSREYGNNISIDHDGKCVTYSELIIKVDAVKKTLKKKGVRENDNVAVLVDNSIEFVQAFFAVNMCGAVIVPIYVNTGIEKLINIFNAYDIKYIITLSKYKNTLNNSIFKFCPKLAGIFYFSDDNELIFFANRQYNVHIDDTPLERELSDVALILLSSGTTNLPKGIMLTDKNIISNIMAISEYLRLYPQDKILLIKNINHASSITGELLVGIYNGCTIYFTSKIPSSTFILEFIDKKGISIFFAIPSILKGIVDNKNVFNYHLSSLRIINFYGAVMPDVIIEELAERFPEINLIYSYGLTEASPRVSYIFKDDLLRKKKSSGRPIGNVEIFIKDINEVDVQNGDIGEIVVKGPNVMKGYYKNKNLTEKVLKNGLLFTGDHGYLDDDGYVYVTGRKDNLIIISGKNVYPEEIENLINNMNGVREVLVDKVPDELTGYKLVAYIVIDKDVLLSEIEVFNFCKNKLEDYKIPNKIIFVNELKKTVSGKIIRNQGGKYEG